MSKLVCLFGVLALVVVSTATPINNVDRIGTPVDVDWTEPAGSAAVDSTLKNLGQLRATWVGNVDGKSFWAAPSGHTWAQAEAYCRDEGMSLASITTAAQHNFLVSKHDILDPISQPLKYFWVNGVVRLAADAYEWVDTRQPVVPFSGSFASSRIMNLAFVAGSSAYGHLGGYPNTYPLAILCEKPDAIGI